MRFRRGLTVLAVDPVEAWLALADILSEHIPSPCVAPHSTHSVVGAGVRAAGPWGGGVSVREAPVKTLKTFKV